MLIQKRNAPEINDIVTIKLNSGEEVIGRLSERTANTVSLAKPVQLVMQPIGPNQMGLSLQPLLASANDLPTLQFALEALAIRPVKTSDSIADNYVQATTGLIPASELPPGIVAG